MTSPAVLAPLVLLYLHCCITAALLAFTALIEAALGHAGIRTRRFNHVSLSLSDECISLSLVGGLFDDSLSLALSLSLFLSLVGDGGMRMFDEEGITEAGILLNHPAPGVSLSEHVCNMRTRIYEYQDTDAGVCGHV